MDAGVKNIILIPEGKKKGRNHQIGKKRKKNSDIICEEKRMASRENIKNKDSYLDEPDLLVTPLFDTNEDECLNPGGDVDEIELLIHHDPSTLKMSVASILEGFTDEPSLEENDDLFDLESEENKWKKILYDSL
nr:hypothetical protein [Tanacetum cinerariifolium]